MLVAEKLTGRNYSRELYLLTCYMLFMILSSIIGSVIFILVRTDYVSSSYARRAIPYCIFIVFLVPILTIIYYRKRIDLDELRHQVSCLSTGDLKKERRNGIISVMFCSCLILIALSFLTLLIKLNTI